MAISRLVQTTLQNGFEKYNSIWDGRSAVGSMDAISSVSLSSAQSSVEFNNIPSTYTHLQVRLVARSGSGSSNDSYMNLTFNSDANSNYASHQLFSDGSASGSNAFANQTVIYIHRIPGGSTNSSTFGAVILDILDYANTNKYKIVRTLGGWDASGSGRISISSGLWQSNSAITRIMLTPEAGNFPQYSQFTLYGIK